MESSPTRTRVCAVVVTHHPDTAFPARLGPISTQVGAVVIVDNGSSAAAVEMLRSLSVAAPVHLITNPGNLGIARALNQGVSVALAHGFELALLMDQDSHVHADLVEGLHAARAAAGSERVAVVGSRFEDSSGQSIEANRRGAAGEDWDEVESVVTSGSLLSLAAYAVIGSFRDEFFIDHVDTEYCHRARAKGFLVLQTRRPRMRHTVGAPSAHRLLGRTKWTTNHSAERRYYIARNDTVMLREYGRTGRRSWRLKSLGRCLRLCKRIALYENDKWRKMYAVGQGWWHGVRGRMGPRGSG